MKHETTQPISCRQENTTKGKHRLMIAPVCTWNQLPHCDGCVLVKGWNLAVVARGNKHLVALAHWHWTAQGPGVYIIFLWTIGSISSSLLSFPCFQNVFLASWGHQRSALSGQGFPETDLWEIKQAKFGFGNFAIILVGTMKSNQKKSCPDG